MNASIKNDSSRSVRDNTVALIAIPIIGFLVEFILFSNNALNIISFWAVYFLVSTLLAVTIFYEKIFYKDDPAENVYFMFGTILVPFALYPLYFTQRETRNLKNLGIIGSLILSTFIIGSIEVLKKNPSTIIEENLTLSYYFIVGIISFILAIFPLIVAWSCNSNNKLNVIVLLALAYITNLLANFYLNETLSAFVIPLALTAPFLYAYSLYLAQK